MNEPIGLYLHVPFCTAKCPYCDFYSLPAQDSAMEDYTAALCSAIAAHPFGRLTADTVYFGGGTPSLLGASRLLRILDSCAKTFALPATAEITLEANPGGELANLLPVLRKGGFNRVSFGLQSLRYRELAALGRRHTVEAGVEAVETAFRAGFANISADLMLGIPHQTPHSLSDTVARLGALPLAHVSAYLLKVEEGTPFGQKNAASQCPGEDLVAELYLHCVQALCALGFEQYEISNFARPGMQSRHNLKYWRCQPYLGLGPSAHSYLEGRRFYFPRSLQEFSTASQPFSLPVEDGEGGGFEEYAMLRLRLAEGLDLAQAEERFGVDAGEHLARAQALARHGLLQVDGRNIALTPRGFLLSNSVTGRILYG